MLKDRAYFALDRQDKLLVISGVPISYLKKPVKVEQFNFNPTSIAYSATDVIVVQAEYQLNFLKDLLENISYMGEASTYVVGSYPTDQASYQLATLLTKAYFEYASKDGIYPKVKWIDLGSPDWEFLKSEDTCSLVVIHGLSESTSDTRRLEIAKDFLRKAVHTTRIVLAVTQNILAYSITKLEISPDGAFQLNKTTNRVVV